MKLKIERHLDDIFETEGNMNQVELIEISTPGPVNAFLIVKTIIPREGVIKHEYYAFDSSVDAYVWLDDMGYDILS